MHNKFVWDDKISDKKEEQGAHSKVEISKDQENCCNKLGLSWAKLRSCWDWDSLQLICIEQLDNQSYCIR